MVQKILAFMLLKVQVGNEKEQSIGVSLIHLSLFTAKLWF